MVTGLQQVTRGPVRPPGRPQAALRRVVGLWRRTVRSANARGAFAVLFGLLLCTVLIATKARQIIPLSVYAPSVVIASLYLRPRWMALVAVTYSLELFVATPFTATSTAAWVAVLTNLAVIVLSYVSSLSRSRVGVEGHGGETMFVDLRDRLKAFGELPDLPPGWHAESAVESAYGQSFSGDFVVATKKPASNDLEVTVVDVSGKGVQAGTRSLLLSGALGGLLGETTPDRFLGAANSYLVAQSWEEGFATAVHVSLDLDTGAFDVGSAGHPAAIQYLRGSGRWQLLDRATGPVLGVVEGASYVRTAGVLGHGDALVLYTDGVIETRSRDLSVGVDRMLGVAERLVSQGFSGGAKRLCASARSGETDDRAVVLIWRD